MPAAVQRVGGLETSALVLKRLDKTSLVTLGVTFFSGRRNLTLLALLMLPLQMDMLLEMSPDL